MLQISAKVSIILSSLSHGVRHSSKKKMCLGEKKTRVARMGLSEEEMFLSQFLF